MSSPERHEPQEPQIISIIVPPEVDLIRQVDRFDKKRQRERAKEYFSRTIFPEFLKNFKLKPNTTCNPFLYFAYWPEIGRRSAVSDLMWDMDYLETIPVEDGMIDVYDGQALAIEVTPNGEMLFHTNKSPKESGLILPEFAWMGDEDIQKEYFDKAFLDSKEVRHAQEFTGFLIHD